ncbi:MAG: hypothetical protein C4575_11015 [Desulforudis sp.]|nr:MAG: hypothetical protein C4575_11015 [Desulforudis sp.]
MSRISAEFAACGLGNRVHDALVGEYLAEELIRHLSRDTSATAWREKPVKKVKEPKKFRKKGRPAKGEQREPAAKNGFTARCTRMPRRPSVSCRLSVIPAKKDTKSFKT